MKVQEPLRTERDQNCRLFTEREREWFLKWLLEMKAEWLRSTVNGQCWLTSRSLMRFLMESFPSEAEAEKPIKQSWSVLPVTHNSYPSDALRTRCAIWCLRWFSRVLGWSELDLSSPTHTCRHSGSRCFRRWLMAVNRDTMVGVCLR